MNVHRTVPLLAVADIARSVAFYCDGLGFRVVNRWEPNGQLAWCWLARGQAALMLQQATDEDPPPETWGHGIHLYFICDDADALYSGITARGIQASKPSVTFYGMNQTHLTDPDGYRLCFETAVART